GEETTKLSHWGQYDTERIYQSVGGLLALLTMLPWKEMIIALEQLRAGQAVADCRAIAPIAPAAEADSASTNHSAARATTDLNIDRTQWPMEIQNALDGTQYFCKIRYKAIYWYLVEQIAERLKSGELRNPKIYEFNPDAVYDPKRHCKKTCDHHTEALKRLPSDECRSPANVESRRLARRIVRFLATSIGAGFRGRRTELASDTPASRPVGLHLGYGPPGLANVSRSVSIEFTC
ncbi:MAG: hypothetical protein Q8M16_09450, partial [Pirellulaceae bacterium]|nr:hypothetical protein [Pirellulaceae bacterium]